MTMTYAAHPSCALAHAYDLANPFGAETDAAVSLLCASGFDAFLCSSASAAKSGVCVRVAKLDPRVAWTSGRAQAAPVGWFYSEYGDSYVLHAGRIESPGDLPRLRDFVGRLLERATELAST